MVSFSCEVCNDTVIKKKLDQHKQRCHGAYFTCIDCSTTFSGADYRSHTQCISEAEKYEKALYKGKNSSKTNGNSGKVEKPKKNEKVAGPVKKDTEAGINVKKAEKAEKAEKKTEKTNSARESVDISKYAGSSLKQVLKSMSKDTKLDKKELLKKLQLELVDGKVVLRF